MTDLVDEPLHCVTQANIVQVSRDKLSSGVLEGLVQCQAEQQWTQRIPLLNTFVGGDLSIIG
jgi:hypothetical protein